MSYAHLLGASGSDAETPGKTEQSEQGESGLKIHVSPVQLRPCPLEISEENGENPPGGDEKGAVCDLAKLGQKTPVLPTADYARSYARQCKHCGKTFVPKRTRPSELRRNQFCSPKCAGHAFKSRAVCITPKSVHSDRVHATDAIAALIRKGKLARPDHCQQCGKSCKPDGHHFDYAKKDEVSWLCRSCHMKAHWKPSPLSPHAAQAPEVAFSYRVHTPSDGRAA